MPLDVARHLLCRRVAALRFLAHRHQHDVVDVGLQRLADPRRRAAAALRQGFDLLGLLIGERFAGAHGFLFADDPFEVDQTQRWDHEGFRAGQQFIQHDAEHIHVTRGRDRLAADLFGARMVRCHHADVGVRDCDGLLHGHAVVEQLRNAEVEQFGDAVGRDEYV